MSDETSRADEVPPEWLSDADDTDQPQRSLLRELAEDEDSGLIELAAGVWYQPKRGGE